mmetsp:Transcript_54941/g.116767  ORF Transcript_54941/g.116767 Transcript_54941/m.116767 type:complete len:318 (+) Transcript_54941:659-1612(+)
MQVEEEVPGVGHRGVVRLHEYLPHVHRQPLLPREPLAPLAVDFEHVDRPARVAQFLHRLLERLEHSRISQRLILRAQSPVVERGVRAKGLAEDAVPFVVRDRIERVHLAVVSYFLLDCLLELRLSVATHRVNQAILLPGYPMRIAYPLGTVRHGIRRKPPRQRTHELHLKVRPVPHVGFAQLGYILLVPRTARVLAEVVVVVGKHGRVIFLQRSPVLVGDVVEESVALLLRQGVSDGGWRPNRVAGREERRDAGRRRRRVTRSVYRDRPQHVQHRQEDGRDQEFQSVAWGSSTAWEACASRTCFGQRHARSGRRGVI